MTDLRRPITELSNELCGELDGALAPGPFLATLAAAEAQIFGGYKTFDGVFSQSFRNQLDGVIAAAAAEIKKGNTTLCMTGCGTSGRLAFLTAWRYGFHNMTYAIAGGDSAILLSDELPEDDPQQGAADMFRAADGKRPYLVGVTCGLSAPYVAGQLAAALRPSSSASPNQWCAGAATLGFNPAELARDVVIENCWPSGAAATFREVVAEAQTQMQRQDAAGGSNIALLTPVIGPEPVAGSSRMKGGSATLVILDILALRILRETGQFGDIPSSPMSIRCGAATSMLSTKSTLDLLLDYQRVQQRTYASLRQALPPLMAATATALAAGGRAFYLGTGAAGVVGCIDMSEMPDTYGSAFDQMRGFVSGGWATLCNREGDLSSRSALHRIGVRHFQDEVLPSIGNTDIVIAMGCGDDADGTLSVVLAALRASKQAGATVAFVSTGFLATPGGGSETFVSCLTTCKPLVCDATVDSDHSGFADYALKLALNAISTYAQAAGRGALFRGLMISAGPSNDKIYQRCVRMIAEHVGVTEKDAEHALIRSIYCRDELSPELLAQPRVVHIKAALLPEDQRHMPQLVLPAAFLLAIPGRRRWTAAAARAAVREERQLSRLLKQAIASAAAQPSSDASFTVIAVDLGGTNVRAAAVSPEGRLLTPVSRAPIGANGDRSPSAVCESIRSVVSEAIAGVDGGLANITAIAIGQPGAANADGTFSHLAAFPEWGEHRCEIAAFLRSQLRRPELSVFVFDDAECAVAAEVSFGAARLARTAVAITVGTGVGSGIALDNGRVMHRGARGLIEVGHMIVTTGADAPLCPCGQRGCVEAFIGGRALVAASGQPDAETAIGLADVDARCAEAVRKGVEALAAATLNVVRVVDPDVVVFCGPIAHRLFSQTQKRFRELLWTLHDDAALVPLTVSMTSEPGVVGAAAQAFRALQRGGAGAAQACGFFLRRATLADSDALYNVCLKTGDAGSDGTHLFSDPRLLGSIFTGPYVTLSQKFAFALVDERDDSVCGYVLGVLDTAAFNAVCDRDWWPRLRAKYPQNAIGHLRPNERELVLSHIHERRVDALDPALLSKYPSHMHIDLLPHAQGSGMGAVMVNRLLAALRGAGSCGVHLGMQSTNARAFRFYTKLGFTLQHKGETEWILVKSLGDTIN